jgi:uncharacterized protein YkwD
MTRRGLLLFIAAPPKDLAQAAGARVNEERRARGLPALAWDSKLASAARQHSERMVQGGSFSHVDPEFGDVAARLNRLGIPWKKCAENIAEQNGFQNPAEIAVRNWMQSPGHRKNILNRDYTRTGVGVAVRRDGTTTFTQIFVAL